jgi:hypothetical protein
MRRSSHELHILPEALPVLPMNGTAPVSVYNHVPVPQLPHYLQHGLRIERQRTGVGRGQQRRDTFDCDFGSLACGVHAGSNHSSVQQFRVLSGAKGY